MRVLLAAGAALLIIGTANAQTTPQECSSIGDSLQRLTCFDKLFPKQDAINTNEETVPLTPSKWDISEERSPIDDSPRITATLLPKNIDKESARRDTPMLAFRCYDNTTSVIYLHSRFSSTEQPRVTYRVSSTSPVTERWSRSDNYQSVGLWRGDKAIPFMKKFKDGDTLAVQTDDPRSEAVFDLGNVEAVVSKISDACNWK